MVHDMRTHAELLSEIALRAMLGLPRIELTKDERERAFGDVQWNNKESHDAYLAVRLLHDLPMSKADKSRARKYLKSL
jgi:hypothetical protein